MAKASGKDCIVLNNPIAGGKAEKELQHPDIVTKEVLVVRDGRAVIRSYCRYYPEADYLDVVKDWFYPSAATFPFDPSVEDRLSVRYEDAVADQGGFLERVGGFLGLEYSDGASRFWEFDHHATAGNGGTLGTVRRFQGRPFNGPDSEYREEKYQQLLRKTDDTVLDRRWESDLGDRDRLIFDHYCGEINERWGYTRDRFTMLQFREFDNAVSQVAKALPPVVEPPKQPHPVGPRSVRNAIRFKTMRTHGLHLVPREVKLLGGMCMAIFIICMALVAVLASILF